MMTRREVWTQLREIKPYLKERYGLSSMALFGSYAREEQNADSDIDLLVEFNNTPDLLSFIEMEEFVSRHLRARVDLVPRRKLRPRLRESIIKEAVVI